MDPLRISIKSGIALTRKLHLVTLCSIFAVLTACNGSAAPTTTTSTTVKLGSPQDELDSLAKSLNSVDYSRISESTCGKFSLIVIPGKVQFYEWKATGWTERSELFGQYSPGDPYLVTTRDYTNDGVNEFLVTSARKVPIGAIFGQIDCKWQWLTFQGQMGPEQTTIDGLTWSDDALQLSGIDYDENWSKFNSTFTWDPHNKTFFSEPAESDQDSEIYVEPTEQCRQFIEPVSYFAVKTRVTLWSNAYKSFVNCSRYEWISFANTNKSPFTNWDMYLKDFYAKKSPLGGGIILTGQSAAEVLDKACLELKNFKGELVFEVDRSDLNNYSACTK